MNHVEQIKAFERDLDALISRYGAEFSLTNAAAIGVLEIKKHALISSALDPDRDEPEFPTGE